MNGADAEKAYDCAIFAKKVDWNNGLYLRAAGALKPRSSDGHRQDDVMGAQADPELLKAEANAHHKAIGSISDPNGMTPKADWDGVNIALGRALESVSKSTVMDCTARCHPSLTLVFLHI